MSRILFAFRSSIVTRISVLKRISTTLFPWRRSSGISKVLAERISAMQRLEKPMRRCPICNKDGNGTGEIVRFIGRPGACSTWNALCPCCGGRSRIPAKADDYHAFRKQNEGLFLQLG